MNWNIFNAGWGKILHLSEVLPAGFANIATFGNKGLRRTTFFGTENPPNRGKVIDYEKAGNIFIVRMVFSLLLLPGWPSEFMRRLPCWLQATGTNLG